MSYQSYLNKLLNENEKDLKVLKHVETKNKDRYIDLIKFSDTFYSVKEYENGIPIESKEFRDLKSADEHFNKIKVKYE
jgi:hypothetical protein